MSGQPRPRHLMDPIERLIRDVLLAGVALSVALMTAGLVLGLLHGTALARGAVPLAELPHELAALRPGAYLSLGIIVLIATPFVRVAGSLAAFVLERDRRYALITGIVLAVMCLSVLVGWV